MWGIRRIGVSIKRLAISLVISLGVCTVLWADSFTGGMSYGDGLTGADVWSSAELSWTVDNITNPGSWTYAYTFAVGAKDISYVITGVGENLTSESVTGGSSATCDLGTWGHQGNSAPGIPGDFYGLKCTPDEDPLTYSWSIVTEKGPRWNSFYAKSGKHNRQWVFAHNTGFGTEPPNPTITDGNNGGWLLAPAITFHEQTVRGFAIDRFLHIRDIVAPDDEKIPEAEFIGHHIQVSSENWVYVLDDTGQQIFRPRNMYPHIESSLFSEIPSLSEWKKWTVPQSTIDEATRVAMAALATNYLGDLIVDVETKRELIALKYLDSPETPMTYHEGRTKILFRPETPDAPLIERTRTQFTNDPEGRPIIQAETVYSPPRSHETAISLAHGRVLRVDSVFLTPDDRAVVELFRDGLMNGYIKGVYPQIAPMVFGTFFQNDEWRFPFSAHTWEGEDFITTSEPDCILTGLCNPYQFEPIPYCTHLGLFDDPRVVFDDFRTTNAYKHEYWHNWQFWGRRNGIRGNCEDYDVFTQTCLDWEIDNWIIRHNDLGNYGWLCPDPDTPPPFCVAEYSDWFYCTGETTVFPSGGGYTMRDAFYSDLEESHVAMLTAHGGPAWGIDYYQFQPYRGIWAYVHTAGLDGLGKGNLRHLFLSSCAGMNMNEEEPYYLADVWLNNHVADGIRSVFGTDGAFYASPFEEGLMFFRYYHSGDSVNESWSNMALTIDSHNVPVGVGYGDNPFDALASLLDQRFSRTRAGNTVGVVLTFVD